jgi:DNA modification methylase
MQAEIIQGDVLDGLRSLPSEIVQTCVTSPPYYGLRDYGTATWKGGRKGCKHKPVVKPRSERPSSGLHSLGYTDACQQPAYRDVCGLCGARRVDLQIGLEETPEAYVARLVAVFREVRRVLKKDGTCWLNLGDSYAGGKTGRADHGSSDPAVKLRGNSAGAVAPGAIAQRGVPAGLKPKDIIGVPWRVAFALQADGWYLRQDIIWAKPNPMPESVRDRCTKAHEYVFLLAKSERYLYDSEAVKEQSAGRERFGNTGRKMAVHIDRQDGARRDMRKQQTRNRRSVWTIVPRPYKGAHFAVMPEGLVEPCILAGSRPGDLVLDPFTGSGTVGVVALRHGRRFVGTELNPEYIGLAEQRLGISCPVKAAA